MLFPTRCSQSHTTGLFIAFYNLKKMLLFFMLVTVIHMAEHVHWHGPAKHDKLSQEKSVNSENHSMKKFSSGSINIWGLRAKSLNFGLLNFTKWFLSTWSYVSPAIVVSLIHTFFHNYLQIKLISHLIVDIAKHFLKCIYPKV